MGADRTLDLVHAPAQFGKFELLEELGQGGMATVHRAVDRSVGGIERQLVIKRILPELSRQEQFIQMFIEEAKLSARLEHPNIVQIHDFGLVDERYFIAMEYIEGVTLLKFIRHFGRRQGISAGAAAFIAHQVCTGLYYAHHLSRSGRKLGLVHRDISPANVMLAVDGQVKVLDFGIAKAVDVIESEETRSGTIKGKWSYMSPEQVEGQPVTSQSDIFSAGIVLWEMLTGRRLFKAKTDYLTLTNVVRARVPPVTYFRPEVPQAFDAICQRALARDIRERYATADEMACDLELILEGIPFGAADLATMVGPLREGAHSSSASGSSVSDSVMMRDGMGPSGGLSWWQRHWLLVGLGAGAVLTLAMIGALAWRGW